MNHQIRSPPPASRALSKLTTNKFLKPCTPARAAFSMDLSTWCVLINGNWRKQQKSSPLMVCASQQKNQAPILAQRARWSPCVISADVYLWDCFLDFVFTIFFNHHTTPAWGIREQDGRISCANWSAGRSRRRSQLGLLIIINKWLK